ncbi:hypothetical protein evm_013165 [Chilo suppressalis]|nr:hypothetical protein evm_013165 [Chilo suppressalis]
MRYALRKDEVLAINDKVVVRAEDLLSWVCDGTGWRWGLRAVWRGACAPPQEPRATQPLHQAKMDFSDVEREKSALVDTESPGVVVFSYPRYCRYRALLSRLEGIQGDWLRDSLVAALGGYAAPTTNTRILYCKVQPNLVSLRSLYARVVSRGGYETVCRRRLWRALASQPTRARNHYERYLLPYEKHESRNGSRLPNGRLEEPRTVVTIELRDSPHRETGPPKEKQTEYTEKEFTECKEELNLVSKPAEELNREFLESLPKEEKPSPDKNALKITVKPVEKLIEPAKTEYDEKSDVIVKQHIVKDNSRVNSVDGDKRLSDISVKVNEVTQKLGTTDSCFILGDLVKSQPPQQDFSTSSPLATLSALGDKYNGHDTSQDQKSSRPVGRSSLRAVRVKPGNRTSNPAASTPPTTLTMPASVTVGVGMGTVTVPSTGAGAGTVPSAGVGAGKRSPPTVNNFGIHRPPAPPDDDEIIEVPYKPKTPEIIDLDEYPESPQSVKKKKLDILKERGLEVTAVPPWPLPPLVSPVPPLITPAPMLINPAMQHQIMTQASLFQMYNIIPPNYNGVQPPKVIQATSIFGSSGPEKTVYGNPKDPFMPPPHILHGTPVKPTRQVTQTPTPQDILDLTCKSDSPKPAVEIVRVPTTPSPSKTSAQNLTKNYKLMDGKAVVGSNLEITLVNSPKVTPSKNRAPQKRSSNGKFMSSKTPTPPKEARSLPSPSGPKKNPIVVPNYQINARENVSPTSSTGSRDSQGTQPSSLSSMLEAQGGLALLGLQKSAGLADPAYMSALYGLGHLDPRQLAAYREVLANKFIGYSGLLSMGAASGPPTTKN